MEAPNCNHCGQLTNSMAKLPEIVWCGRCIIEHYYLLEQFQLHDLPAKQRSADSQASWVKPENLLILKNIPKYYNIVD